MAAELHRLGSRVPTWQEGNAKSISFIVTEDCQLACKYCFLRGKNNQRKMSWDVARCSVDCILEEGLRGTSSYDAVIWEFTGGEPFLEIDLIDALTDYIRLRMYELDHPWFNSYRVSISSNGLLYSSPAVQRFIEKNRSHINIGISLDGTPEKHDINRVFKDGQGSYGEIAKSVPLWLQQFPKASTKATVSSDDLAMVKDSVLHLWNIGIKTVHMNVVFEDVWKDGDDDILEGQLMGLADVILRDELYREYNVSWFAQEIGQTLNDVSDDRNWCGSGKMLCVDCEGKFYPCHRFTQFSLSDKPARTIGDCYSGVDRNRVRPFLALRRSSLSPEECMKCEVARGCAWCIGFNYDDADTDTIFRRATYICKMHKARVRANDYYWRRLQEVESASR